MRYTVTIPHPMQKDRGFLFRRIPNPDIPAVKWEGEDKPTLQPNQEFNRYTGNITTYKYEPVTINNLRSAEFDSSEEFTDARSAMESYINHMGGMDFILDTLIDFQVEKHSPTYSFTTTVEVTGELDLTTLGLTDEDEIHNYIEDNLYVEANGVDAEWGLESDVQYTTVEESGDNSTRLP